MLSGLLYEKPKSPYALCVQCLACTAFLLRFPLQGLDGPLAAIHSYTETSLCLDPEDAAHICPATRRQQEQATPIPGASTAVAGPGKCCVHAECLDVCIVRKCVGVRLCRGCVLEILDKKQASKTPTYNASADPALA